MAHSSCAVGYPPEDLDRPARAGEGVLATPAGTPPALIRRREAAARARDAYCEQAAGRREDYFWLRDEQRHGLEQAAERVGRSRRAQRYGAQRLGGSLPKAPPWTREETATALRTDLTIREISGLIGRAETAVRQKRRCVRTRDVRKGSDR